MQDFKTLIVNELAKGRNVIFVPRYDSELSDDFITYLWANFYVSTQEKGMYFHIDIPLSIDERIRNASPKEVEAGFLTDEKLSDKNNAYYAKSYKGWEVNFDNQTGAIYYYDEASQISLYCSPSFEGDWGNIGFYLSSEYEIEGDAHEIEDMDVTEFFGRPDLQANIWESKVRAIIDNITDYIPNYYEICLRSKVGETFGSLFPHSLRYKANLYDREAYAKINDLENQVVDLIKAIQKY